MVKYVLMSDLLKTGIKYFTLDKETIIYFNDGTIIQAEWTTGSYSEYAQWSDLEFSCYKDGELYDVIDDVRFNIKLPNIKAEYKSTVLIGPLDKNQAKEHVEYRKKEQAREEEEAKIKATKKILRKQARALQKANLLKKKNKNDRN